MTTKEQETLDNLVAIFAALVAEHFDGIDPFQIKLSDNIKELLLNDAEKFNLVIKDFLDFYQMDEKVDFEDAFARFPKVEDLVRFIAEKME